MSTSTPKKPAAASKPSSRITKAEDEDADSYDELDYTSDEGDEQDQIKGPDAGFMPEQGLIRNALAPYYPRQVSNMVLWLQVQD
jgi:hypothetical protein